MSPGQEPTRKQLAILKYIWEYLRDHNRPPALREIEHAVGFNTVSAVSYQIGKLENKAYLTRDDHVARGLRLTKEALGLLEQFRHMVQEATGMVQLRIKGDIAAGEPVEFEDEESSAYDEEDTVALDATLLPWRIEKLRALRVRGNSMIDALVQDRDIVILQKVNDARTEVRNGDMVAAWLQMEQEMTLKHFFLEGERVRLQPANPSFEPITVHASNVDVQGKVVLVQRQMP
jgi:repressor LexA